MENNQDRRTNDDRRLTDRDTAERREASLDLETGTFKATGKSFEVHSVETHADGSVDIALEMDDETKQQLCNTFGWDKVTEERLQSLVLEALDWHVKNKLETDGGDTASTAEEE